MGRGSIIGIACVVISFLLAFWLSEIADGYEGGSTPSGSVRAVSLRRLSSSSGGSGRGWGYGGK